jgi:hypothetical protein
MSRYNDETGPAWAPYILAGISLLDLILCGVKNPPKGAYLTTRYMLPYMLHPVPDRPDLYIWLNRDYKPLGTYCSHSFYQRYTSHHVRIDDPRLAKLVGKLIKVKGMHDRPSFAFYDDMTAPHKSRKTATEHRSLLKMIDVETPPNIYEDDEGKMVLSREAQIAMFGKDWIEENEVTR